MNKRGMELAVTTIIMVALSIVVLTVLIVFFISQTGLFSQKLEDQSMESNVDLVINSCNGLVTSESVYAYCCESKKIVFGDGEENLEMSCDNVSRMDWAGDRLQEMDCSSVDCV